MTEKLLADCKAAGERYYRCYQRHCVVPDIDTLYNLLNSIHSFNDKLKKATGANFFECNEFIALKALRNLFHHQAELINEVRMINSVGMPLINSDLIFLCLVPSTLVVQSIEQLEKNRRLIEEPLIRATFKWYRDVVNINPCIFNFAVHAYEKLQAVDIRLEGDEYSQFEHSYQFEAAVGHPHFVTGDITCHAGSVEEVLTTLVADVI